MAVRKKSKEEPAPHQPPCHTCNGLCCRHIAKPIDRPTTKTDFDNIRWYLMHDRVLVGIDHDNSWMIEVATKCRYLRDDYGCEIYTTRPNICRDYPAAHESCEHEDKTSTYKLLFSDDKQLVDWLAKTRPKWKFGV